VKVVAQNAMHLVELAASHLGVQLDAAFDLSPGGRHVAGGQPSDVKGSFMKRYAKGVDVAKTAYEQTLAGELSRSHHAKPLTPDALSSSVPRSRVMAFDPPCSLALACKPSIWTGRPSSAVFAAAGSSRMDAEGEASLLGDEGGVELASIAEESSGRGVPPFLSRDGPYGETTDASGLSLLARGASTAASGERARPLDRTCSYEISTAACRLLPAAVACPDATCPSHPCAYRLPSHLPTPVPVGSNSGLATRQVDAHLLVAHQLPFPTPCTYRTALTRHISLLEPPPIELLADLVLAADATDQSSLRELILDSRAFVAWLSDFRPRALSSHDLTPDFRPRALLT
jgi:hypothetical protein